MIASKSGAVFHLCPPSGSGEKPAILYLTNALPLPAHSGGQVREYQLLSRLQKRFAIHFVGFCRDFDYHCGNVPLITPFLASVTLVRAGAEPSAMSSVPARMAQHAASRGLAIVEELIRRFSPKKIHAEGYFMMQHIPPDCPLPVVLVAENVEYELAAGSEENRATIRRISGGQDAAVAQQEEWAAWRRANVCVAVTPEDAETIRQSGCARAVTCVTNGFDHLKRVPAPSARGRIVLYVANFGWEPSSDAALYLVEEIWPLLRMVMPTAGLRIAGAGMPPEMAASLRRRFPEVEVYGPFGEQAEILTDVGVFICPLRFGGGIKVKVIEALAGGLPVVSTPEGIRGLPAAVRDFIFVAETAPSLALLTAALLEAPCTGAFAGTRGQEGIRQLPTWDESAWRLGDVWQQAAAQ